MKLDSLRLGALAVTVAVLAFSSSLQARDREIPQLPILMIGGSSINGVAAFNDALRAPLGGISVNFGSYLSLGAAMTRTPSLPGFIVNEAQAGATTFDRRPCGQDSCFPGMWQSYSTQLDKALARVTVPDPETGLPLSINAQYVVIGVANDCLHADAFGVPQKKAVPCRKQQLDAAVDRYIAVGQEVLYAGLTPVYTLYPEYNEFDLALAKDLFGLAFVIREKGYNRLRDLHYKRIHDELPDAILVDAWRDFTHIGDGLHPDPVTAMRAAHEVADAIIDDQFGGEHYRN